MFQHITCPKCGLDNTMYSKKRNLYICEDCNHEFKPGKTSFSKLRIFLSYGHDQNEELVRMIKTDLEKRGHDVWFDKSGVKESGIAPGNDWRRAITDGIKDSNQVISFLSKYSTRDPGVCLDEISIAIGVKGGNIQTILVESETEVKAPPSISYIQWLDMHNWKEKRALDSESWLRWYLDKFKEITDVIESDESCRFAGEIETLAGYLRPIASDSRISQLLQKGFVGRRWLIEAVEQWRAGEDRSSSLFWIKGNPGVGKSTFSAYLSHFGKDKVIAVQFCEYDKPDHNDAARVICNLAFQLASRLPDYRKLLLALPEIYRLETKGASELFDYLLANPLKQVIGGERERYLILIDALDEAKVEDHNPLVEMLARYAPRLPDWLGIVVTSRTELNVSVPLQGLNPVVMDTDSETNKEDIRQYLSVELKVQLELRSDARNIIEQILQKSEGIFLYVERVCNDVKEGNLLLAKLEDFPKGLGGIYLQFFQRQFPDTEKYRKEIRPALRAILAGMEPLPVNVLGKLFNWKHEKMNDFIRLLGSLFQVVQESERKVIKPFHKSTVDWITNENIAGAYFVCLEEGNHILAGLGWQQFMLGPENMDPYYIKWLPRHLLKLEIWDDLVNLICDLEYIQEKVAAKLTYHLVEDFNQTLQYIPDNADNILEENKGQARMDKYILDLIAYAKGKINKLEVPETVPLWNEEKVNTDIGRKKTNPTRLDRLNDFKNFLGIEAANLHIYAHKFPHFATQQAWNYADCGPVKKEAESQSPDILNPLFLRITSSCSPWNPFPQVIHALKGHSYDVHSIAITPDGKRAISGSKDNTCIIWDTKNGQAILTLKGHNSEVHSVSITPDGKKAISGSEDQNCIVWNLETGHMIFTLIGHTSPVYSVAITSDGLRAISGSLDNTCIIWDLISGQPVNTLKGHHSAVLAIAITADGKRAISGSYDMTCIFWDLSTGQILKTLTGHTSSVNAVALTPDGKRAISGSSDRTCIIWDPESGQAKSTLNRHASYVDAVAISSDGTRAISGSGDQTCILWDLNTGETINTLKGHTDWVFGVAITSDGRKGFSVSKDKSCIVWDLNSRQKFNTPVGHTNIINAAGFTPDGKYIITGGADSTCILWNSVNGNVIHTLKGHTSSVIAVDITPDGSRAISVSNDNTKIIWDLKTGSPVNILLNDAFRDNDDNLKPDQQSENINGARVFSITPDGKKALFVSENYSCIVWDIRTGKVINKTFGHTGYITAIAITPDGRLAVTGSTDKTCIIWDLNSGQLIKRLNGHSSTVSTLCISPDGQRVISGSNDKTCIIWDLKTGRPINTFNTHSGWIRSVEITPDGKRAISCSDDGTCNIWDLFNGKVIHTIKEFTATAGPYGGRVIYGSEDNSCLIYDLDNDKNVGLFIANKNINLISMLPGGAFICEISGKIYILRIDKRSGCNYSTIVTIKQSWDYELQKYQEPSADCPQCGNRFQPPSSVFDSIEKITKKAELKHEQSPCLTLPDENWKEPGLLGYCPECGEKLRYNPFIAGG